MEISKPCSRNFCSLPSTGVTDGKRYRFFVEGATAGDTNLVSFAASGGTVIDTFGGNGFIEILALQDAPTLNTHWKVIDVYEEYSHPMTFTGPSTPPTTSTLKLCRQNKIVTFFHSSLTSVATATYASLAGTPSLPARFRPTTNNAQYPCFVTLAGTAQNNLGRMGVGTGGSFSWVKDNAAAVWPIGTNVIQANFGNWSRT